MKHLLLLALFSAPAAVLIAQSDQTIIDRAQQPGAPVLPATQPSVSVAPGDADAGNQRIAEPRKLPFKLSFVYDAQAYYTDNVNLVPESQTEDHALIVAQTLAARAELRSHAVGDGLLTPLIGFNFQRYYHGVGSSDHESLDFDSYALPLSLRYRFGANWEATLGFTSSAIYSLEGPPEYNKIFRAYTPSLSLRKLVGLAQNRILSLGTGVSYAFTKADRDGIPAIFSFRDDRNDKMDLSIDAAYYHLLGKWVFSPYARVTYSDYSHYQEAAFNDVDRRDVTGSLGVSVSYNFTHWASARIFTSYDWRKPQGDSPVDYSYETANAGLGLTLSASF
jgi:hypothetical protein